jgi:hypothetical protein
VKPDRIIEALQPRRQVGRLRLFDLANQRVLDSRHGGCVDGDAMNRQDWLMALKTFLLVYLIL